MNKISVYNLSILLLIFGNIFSKQKTTGPVYESIDPKALIRDLGLLGNSFSKFNLITEGLPKEYTQIGTKLHQFIDPDLYKQIDAYVGDEELNKLANDIIKTNGEKLINDWYSKVYEKYIYPAAKEKQVADGKQIKDLNPNFIILRKDVLKNAHDAYNSIYSENSKLLSDLKLKLANLKDSYNKDNNKVMRYEESLLILDAIINLFEKVLSKISSTDEQLQKNYDNRK